MNIFACNVFLVYIFYTLFDGSFGLTRSLKSGVMKKLAMMWCILISAPIAFGQLAQTTIHQKSDCAAVTQRILEQQFSLERQLEIQSSPEELACLNYLCAFSYEFAPGQTILRSQRSLFNIEKYKHLRRADQRVTVYDEQTDLKVVLYSWNEVEAQLNAIRLSYQLASCD